MVPRMTRGLPVPVINILDEFCKKRCEFLAEKSLSKGLNGGRKFLNMEQRVTSGTEEERPGPLIGSDERGSYLLLWR
jgi:hypothetical protein